MIKFENPVNGRYYYICIQKDLLNPIVAIYKGGTQKKIRKIYAFECHETMSRFIADMVKRRLRNGYVQISAS